MCYQKPNFLWENGSGKWNYEQYGYYTRGTNLNIPDLFPQQPQINIDDDH